MNNSLCKDFFDDNYVIFSTSSSLFSYNFTNGYQNWQIKLKSKGTPIIDGDNIFLIKFLFLSSVIQSHFLRMTKFLQILIGRNLKRIPHFFHCL